MTRDETQALGYAIAILRDRLDVEASHNAAIIRGYIDTLAALRSRPAPPDDLVPVTRAQLASIEWALYVDTQRKCPVCDALRRSDVHTPDCWLAAALAAPALVAAPGPETPPDYVVQRRFHGLPPDQPAPETPAPDAMPDWCRKCHGKGYKSVGFPHYDPCPACNGTGRRQEAQPSKLAPGEVPPSSTWGDLGRAAKCSRCNDDGRPCSHCEAQL